MPYFKLQIKQVLKSKFTWISLLAILLGCFYFWIKNYNSRYINPRIIEAKENIALEEKNVRYYQKQLQKANLTKTTRRKIELDLAENKSSMKEFKTLIKAIQTNKWHKAYQIIIKQEKYNLADAKRNNASKDNILAIESNIQKLQYLKRNNLPEENEHYSVKGGFFILEMMQEVLPPLAVLAVIFILIKLYSSGFYERMRLANLLPQKNHLLIEFGTSSLIGFGYFLAAFLLLFIIPSIFFGTGNFKYPMMGIDAVAKRNIFIPMYQLFCPTLILELFSFMFIANAVLLFVQVFKNRLLALFISVLILVGAMVLPQYVVAARNFAQFIPMSYFFSLQPVDGMFGISNAYVFADETKLVTYPQVNFTNGMLVLALGIILLLFLNYLTARKAQKGRKTK
ncbi:hypothetical protein F5ESL0260_06250 [Lactobacillus sp. ESL0260]|uniref:hypothetical protein n=1 Tax=Lactobacillus sp. ESL0260 TaxID=2069347 RepID=UPI000EFB3283|nr:hypothetical protein [Lactobacillus sp. ESL0260]RMC57321.1 hypothetical protein F5ESL0260_06250 [Lactobacillus sp. ESL0260]